MHQANNTKSSFQLLRNSIALAAAIIFCCSAEARDNGKSTMLQTMPSLPSIPPYPKAAMEKGWRTVDGAESVNVILISQDNKVKVLDWYKSTLNSNGWKLTTSDERSFRLSGRNNRQEFFTISISDGPDKGSRITVIFIKV